VSRHLAVLNPPVNARILVQTSESVRGLTEDSSLYNIECFAATSGARVTAVRPLHGD